MPNLPSLRPNSRLKGLANRHSGLPLRLSYDLWHSLSEDNKVSYWSESLGISKLRTSEWLSAEESNQTLFILGSGDSVEELPQSAWTRISQGFSIGVNAWPIHTFVPNAYAFEPFDPASVDYVQLFSKVLHERRIQERKPRLLLFRPHGLLDAERYQMIPEQLRRASRLYGRVVPSTSAEGTLAQEIQSLHLLSRMKLLSNSLVVDLGATVLRLISLGILAGFKNIVLVGVDLNGGLYFWEKNPEYLRSRRLESFSPGFTRPVHETMVAGKKAFVLPEVIQAMKIVLEGTGGSLQVAHTSSLLTKFLRVEKWD